MKRLLYCAMAVALTASCDAQTLGGIADIAIIDRDSGVTLNPHYYRGEYWVAGKPGARYAIEIHNRLGERLLAVTSVDGVNVLSGATAGWNQEGYVFGPDERYRISGWRKTDAEVAAFTFTEAPNSYAERTGRPANVGVIGVAVFRESRRLPLDSAPLTRQAPAPMQSPATPPSFNEADAARASESGMSRTRPGAQAFDAPQTAAKLGTGHGEREYSYVQHTDFRRMQQHPDEVIRIHYDSMDNLMAMGIVRRPSPTQLTPNPFPDSPNRNYVPDPPG